MRKRTITNAFLGSRHDSIPFDSYLCAHSRNRLFHTFCGRSDGRTDSATKQRRQSRRNCQTLQARGKTKLNLLLIEKVHHIVDQKVWIAIVVSMFCVGVVTWLTKKVTAKYSRAYERNKAHAAESILTNHILVAFGVISCQGIIFVTLCALSLTYYVL